MYYAYDKTEQSLRWRKIKILVELYYHTFAQYTLIKQTKVKEEVGVNCKYLALK